MEWKFGKLGKGMVRQGIRDSAEREIVKDPEDVQDSPRFRFTMLFLFTCSIILYIK